MSALNCSGLVRIDLTAYLRRNVQKLTWQEKKKLFGNQSVFYWFRADLINYFK